jgi:tetratricopeptide (TPR) repeat protein
LGVEGTEEKVSRGEGSTEAKTGKTEEQIDSAGGLWADDSARTTWILASALLAVALVLHGLGYYLLPGWLWGADTLYSLSGGSVGAMLVLGVLSLWPRSALISLAVLNKAWDISPRWATKDVVSATVLVGTLSALMFWKMGVPDPVGGAWLFHAPYIGPAATYTPTVHSLPLLMQMVASGLTHLLDTGHAQTVRGITIGLGVVFCCLTMIVPRREGLDWRVMVGFLLALSGAVLVFIGPRADLAFEAFATATFLILGLISLHGYVSPFLPGLIACCAALVHPLGLALLPAWAFLLWRRRGAGISTFWLALIGSLAVVAAALVILDVTVGGALDQLVWGIKSIWGTGSGTRASWVLDSFGGGGALGSVAGLLGWLLERIWGTFNGLLFVAPVGLSLAVAALVSRSSRPASSALAFLGIAVLVTGLMAFCAAPYSGPPRSWGLYVPLGVCVTVAGAWWLAQQLARGISFKAVALGAVVISLIHVLPLLSASKRVELGAERLSWLVTAPSPWDVRGRATALEQMGAFYLVAGDTLLAAEQLKEAWRMRPNPLYLGAAGTYYAGLKRYDLAEDQFSALVEARPQDREANLSLGIVKALNGRYDDARQYLLIAYGDTSLTLPEPVIDTPYWVDLPHGPEREEIREHRMGLRKNSQDTFEVGEDAFKRGDLSGAEQLYKRALQIYPNWGRMQYEVYCHVGTIYSMRGQTKEAAFEFLRALHSYRNYPLCYFIENGVGYGPVRYTTAARQDGDAVPQGK